MKKSILRKLFAVFVCLFVMTNVISQAPSTDIDSITEDSYRRMRHRQELEQKSDSIALNAAKSELKKSNLKNVPKSCFFGVAFSIAVFLAWWYFRKKNKNKQR
ncbi:MAG: hypothetical protein AB8B59_16030 [Maribacter sp.]